MGKFLDALKPFDEFRAPWETEGGTDAEIDKTKLKRFIYNLTSDKAKAQDAREEAVEKVTSLEAELETAKADVAKASPEEANKKIEKLERDLAAAKEKVSAFEKADEQRTLRDEVLGDLDKKYAKYVTGETREELEKSLEQVKEDFGLSAGDDDEEEEEEEQEDVLRSRPRSRLRNPIDTESGKDKGGEIDFDKVAEEILGANRF